MADKQHPTSAGTPLHTSEDQTTRRPVSPSVDDQPFLAGFWDRDHRTAAIRHIYITNLFRGTLLTAIVIMAVLSIYWGAFWKIQDDVHHFNAWVVDFDSSAMGQVVQSAAINATGPLDRLSWSVVPPSQFPSGPSDVIQAVLDEKCWVAIVVNPGATARLNSAVSTLDTSYNGSLAATIYAIEARNENSYPLFIAPLSQAVMDVATAVFASQHARQLASNPNVTALLTTVPNVVTQPLHFTVNNLRPFDVSAANAADFVGLIYLLIISFLLTNMHYVTRMESGLDRHLCLPSLICVRLVAPITMYFFLSDYDALPRFGSGGFVIFWMLSWVAMCALGLAIEAVVTLITPRFAPYFMILWIIVNVSVCYFPIQILPGVFHYGYATPFYNVSRAVRTIIFSTRNQVGLNFGVGFAWISISLMTIPLFQSYRRRLAVREWQANHHSEKTI